MNKPITFSEQENQGMTNRRMDALRTGKRGMPLALALLFTFAITLLGVGKGWAQCTPNGQGGSTQYYNTCSGSSVTLEHTGVGSSPKVLWSATNPPVAYSADFGATGNFQLSSSNSVNYTSISNDAGYSTISATGDVQILMNNLGSFDPNIYKYFIIHYQVTGNAAFAQRFEFFWNAERASGATPVRMLRVYHSDGNYPNFGQSVTVVIDASKHPQWTTNGNITGWRLDPISPHSGVEVTIRIDYVALTSVKPVESGQVLEAYSLNDGQPYINEQSPGVIYGAQLVSINGLDTYGYSSTKNLSNPAPGTTWYSDNLRNWACNSSSIKHVVSSFCPGSITTSSSTICYGSTAALPQITQATAPDGVAPYTYQWRHTYNGTTNVISGATGATYTPPVGTYNTQAGEHVFTRWVKDQNSTDFAQSTGSYTLTVRPQVTVNPSPLSPTLTYGQSVDINVVTSPYGSVSGTTGLPGGVAYNSGTGHIVGTPNAVGTYNYTVSVTDAGNCATATASGTITVNPKTITLNCPSGTAITKTYDGSALQPTATVSGVVNNENANIQYSTNNGSTWSSTAPSITNAGTQAVRVRISNSNYTASECNYTLTVNQRPVTVSVADKTVTYNGSQQSGNTAYTFSNVVSGHTATITYNASSGTNASTTPYDNGSYGNDFRVMSGGTNVTANYTLSTQTKGKLTINKMPVTITALAQTYTYNGSAQGENNATYTSGISSKVSVTGLVSGHSLTSIKLNGQGTNAGQYTITPSAAAVSGGSTGNYSFTYVGGTLNINQRNITLTSVNDSKEYDGSPLTNHNVNVTGDGWVSGHGVTYSFTGSQTLVGSSANAFGYTLTDGANTTNYNITQNEGTLTVTNRTNKYEVTVVANSATYNYDGTSKSVSGFQTLSFTVDGHQYTVSGLTASASGTNAGSYTTTISGTAVVKDANNNNVTSQFIVNRTNGTLTINKVPITITANNASKVYGTADPSPLTATVTGKPANGANPVYTVARAAGENVGTYAITVTATAGNNPNYTVTVQPGTFTITKANITLTCPSGSALTKIYDGTELHPAATATGVVSSDNSSIVIEYSKDNGATWSTTVAGITQVGTQAVKVRATHANYNTATCEYTLEVTQPNVTITGTLPALTVSGCATTDVEAYSTVAELEAALQGTGAGITNYCGTLSVSHSDSPVSGSCTRYFSRTYTVSNTCSMSATVTQTITLNMPDFTMPADGGTTVACSTDVAAPQLPPVTDACSTPINGVPKSGYPTAMPTCAGTVTYVYTFTDCAGHSHDWTYVYTISAPTLTFTNNGLTDIENVNACYSTSNASRLKTDAQVQAMYSSNCSRTITVEHTDEQTLTDNCNWKITRTFTISDGCNTETKTQYVSGGDQTAPTIGELAAGSLAPVAAGNCKYTIPDLSSAAVAASSDGCGGAITFVSQSPAAGAEYAQTNVAQNITVTVTVKDACNNPQSKQVTVVIPANTLTVSPTVSTSPICLGASTTVSSNVTGATSPTYSWSSASADAGLPSNLTTANITVTPASAGSKTYTVSVTGNNGCSATATQTVTVNALPVVTISGTTEICQGQNTTLTASASDCSFAWSDGLGSNATTSSISTAGTYTVTATNTTTHCSATASQTVTVNALPVVQSITVPSNACPFSGPFNVSATVNGGSGTYTTYTWGGDANTANAASTTVTEAATGQCGKTYTVSLTVTDNNGCVSQEATQSFLVQDLTAPTISGTMAGETVSGCVYADAPAATNTIGYLTSKGLTISDNCTANADLTVTSSDGALSGACAKTFTRTYTVTDACGNSSTVNQTITLNMPDFTITPSTGSATVNCPADVKAADVSGTSITLPTVTDACGNTLTGTLKSGYPTAMPSCEGTVTYVYTFTDCANHAHDYTFTYTIDMPAFTVTPSTGSATVNCPADAKAAGVDGSQITLPTVTDRCGNTLTPTLTTTPSAVACEGDIVYVYTYEDCAHNTATYTFTYTVDMPAFTVTPATGSATVNCPADAKAAGVEGSQITLPTVTDRCGNTL
ncbi:MAG: putative Ig domain-containing protein, partial [Bacteroidales bacterium]|nr:putative Ig domain-containing protein [Bacteroidales bacterium]